MNQCKRLSDCPAERLAQCRGQAVQARCDALQGLLNKADQQISDLTHAAPVPAGFASGRDEDNMVLLDKRDLFDAVRGALKEQMQALPFGDAADLWAESTAAADECLKDLVSKGAVPPAGDVEVLKVQYRVTAGPMTGWSFWNDGNGDQYREYYQVQVRELVDRAHVTRLTAERDGLLAEIEAWKSTSETFEDFYRKTEDELTKARELLARDAGIEGITRYSQLRKDIQMYLAHNVDESCGQDAEAAKGGA